MSSVQEGGVEPVVRSLPEKDDYLAALREAVGEARSEAGLTAVVAESDGRLKLALGSSATPSPCSARTTTSPPREWC